MEKMDKKNQIFESLIPYFTQHGWQDLAIQKWAEIEGNDRSSLQMVFPAMISDCLTYFVHKMNVDLLQHLGQVDLVALRIPERIKLAVMTRFKLMYPYRDLFAQEILYFKNPLHAKQGVENLYKIVDCIWFGIGDQSTDFNFYTKRFTLACVYKATFLYWLKDDSENSINSSMFLDRRLENISFIPKMKKKINDLFGRFYIKA